MKIKKILLVTEASANARRQEYFYFLASLQGSVSKNIEHALKFDSEEQIKAIKIRHTFVMFEYDGKELNRLGCIM